MKSTPTRTGGASKGSRHIDQTSYGPVCPSCGSARTALFCADCGERVLCGHDFNLSHFLIQELPHEAFHMDGKLPRTLKLLFRHPGYLPAQYVAGRRVRFVNPLRLYLVAFLVYAFVAALPPHVNMTLPQRAAQTDPTGWVAHLAASRSVRWDDPLIEERIGTRAHWASEGGTMLVFLCVALVQMAIFRRFHRRYLEHALLALSVATATILVVLCMEIVSKLAGTAWRSAALTQGLVLAAIATYWYFAVRSFYGASAVRAMCAALVIAAAQILIAQFLNALVLALLVITA